MWFQTLSGWSSGEMFETVLLTIRTHSDLQNEPRRRRLAQRFIEIPRRQMRTEELAEAHRGIDLIYLTSSTILIPSQEAATPDKGPLLPEPPLLSLNLSLLLSCEPLSVWTVRRHERQSGCQKPFGGQNI